jgi:hypothetical protein
MELLAQYYKGEDSWIEYSSLYADDWTDSNTPLQLLNICNGKIDLAKVISYHPGEQRIKWRNSNVPGLDNLVPIICLEDHKLINRLKVCLMRFPS